MMMAVIESAEIVTAGSHQAQENWDANLAALAIWQPSVVVEAVDSPAANLVWVFGRDGYLTAKDPLGRWWAGCSLPKRAGMTMLKKLDLRGVVGCLLAPTHAGQVTAALDKILPRQAIVVIHPDLESVRVLLGCCDFSAEIARHRLWFAVGESWPMMLSQLFADQPGLATPCQFIRTPATNDDLIQKLIPIAERAFNECNADRAMQLGRMASEASSISVRSRRLLVLAGSHFRLWDDAGATLLAATHGSDEETIHLDPDNPAQASALGLALASQGCGGVVVPNRSRSELPAVLPSSISVCTWVTQPRLPAFDVNHSNDGLLLADETWMDAAKSLGWPENRLKIAGWPIVPASPGPEKSLALIADTFTLETPVKALESSSHHVLWELIRADLSSDPFSMGTDVAGFIHRRMAKLGISQEGLDESMFIDKLVMPAYQQGLARLLLEAGLPLKVFGKGWDALPRLGSVWGGRVDTREQFRVAAQSASVLIYPWPNRVRHEIDAMGRTVLFPNVRRRESWVRDAKASLNGVPRLSSLPTISRWMVQDLLG